MKRVGALALSAAIALVSAVASNGGTDYTALVDPFIGTGGHGHTYPGASLPFGMVQLSPDTRLTGWDGCSAYHYSDSLVYGFSHTHLSGTGCSDYGDILLMPAVNAASDAEGGGKGPVVRSRFRHESEEASPGYYSVFLDDYGIEVELTVTERAGFHRYTFPKSDEASIIIDLEHRDRVIESGICIEGDSEVTGMRRSKAWAEDQHIYFAAVFSKPFDSYGIAADGEFREGSVKAAGRGLRAVVGYRTGRDEEILVKVGISAVSVEGARRNLEAEIPGWDFEKVREGARLAWNLSLDKIRVEGGTEEQLRIFYTSLYHATLAPNLFMDVDGRYRGRDLEVHEAKRHTHYTVFSLWDTYRAAHPLYTIIEPERTVDFINTFIKQYEEGGRLPVWELAGNETDCMIGYHSVSVIADAYIKGIRGFDALKALEAMKHSAELDREGLGAYREFGYIPGNMEAESVSRTLEYAYDDWCIAQMARELGRRKDYERYIRRAQYYKNVHDASTGFMRGKMNSSWVSPFEPAEVSFNYTEANSWQYSFCVPQDVRGLIACLEGKENFIGKLDELFASDSRTTGRHQVDISGMIGQYAHGNEPSHHMAYLYSYANQPWKTQKRVREIMDVMYTIRPDGLCGNEDCGQMSAWYVFSSLGFYPVTPGSDIYVIGTPLFKEASIDVGNGRRFIVRANGVSGESIYIQSAELNGDDYRKSFLKHGDIARGGELVFEMGREPERDWGSGDDEIPRSAIEDDLILPVPYVASGDRVFTESTEVSLASNTKGAGIYYTVDGSEPSIGSALYKGPFELTESATVKAVAFKKGGPESFVATAEFGRIPAGRSIELNSPYSSMYAAGGDMALIDHLRGSKSFRTGGWQGYQGVDVDAVVDLGGIENIGTISMGFLQDQGSWIFMPSEVEFAVSDDGKEFNVIATIVNDIPMDREGSVIKDFRAENVDRRGRYVRVRARNIGICPEWHRGSGAKAWLFADEIVIE